MLFLTEGDVAIGVDERFRIAARVEGERERQRHPRAVVVAERNLLADRALKLPVGVPRVVPAGPVAREGHRDGPQVEGVGRQHEIALVPHDGHLADVLGRRGRRD